MRIACFTPLSPQRSGISDYSEALLPHLAQRAEQVDVFVEDYPPAARFSHANLSVRPFEEFDPEKDAEFYDVILYQMGNNPFHVAIYELALRVPGVVVLHEFNLHHLLAAVTIARGDWDGYFREVEYNGGAAALERGRRAQTGIEEPDYDGLAMNRRLLERSQGLIVHSEYMVRAVRQAGFHLPVQKIPHGVKIPAVDRAEARRELSQLAGFALDEATPVFGVFGFLKPYKRIHEALRAFARLRATHPQGQLARMVLVGEEHPRYPLRPLIAELGIEDAVAIAGYVPLDAFTTAMAACDVCLNLRWPTVGETSGSFLRALAMGKPTLVSEVGTFLEFPDAVAIRIPAPLSANGREPSREPSRETDWLYEYMKVLLDDPALGRAVGKRARAYAARECAWPKVAGEYAAFLQKMAAGGQTAGQDARGSDALPVAPPPLDVSTEELEEYIVGFSHDSALMEEYALTHLQRLIRTIAITPPGGPEDRVLELGCYMQMTPALRTYLGYGEVRGAYYGPVGRSHQQSASSASGETFTCWIDLFDAERDRFPYPDGHFQTVLCCELLEHLSTDPMRMVAEINRILAPGGWLTLTTPNITSLRSAHAVLHGYHPGLFSSYIKPGPDGAVDPRHSREFAPREVALLVEAGGFQVDLLETGDYQERQSDVGAVRRLLASNGCPLELRGEVIYCRARKVGPVRERWPKELYYPP